jgi:hypothetical protein
VKHAEYGFFPRQKVYAAFRRQFAVARQKKLSAKYRFVKVEGYCFALKIEIVIQAAWRPSIVVVLSVPM